MWNDLDTQGYPPFRYPTVFKLGGNRWEDGWLWEYLADDPGRRAIYEAEIAEYEATGGGDLDVLLPPMSFSEE